MRKINTKIRRININMKRNMLVLLILFLMVIVKLSFVALSKNVDGIDLTEFANNRNTTKETLYAERGIIYDTYGKPLAKNANSYKIIAILSPSRTKDMSDPKHVVDKELTASKLCEVLAKTPEGNEKCNKTLVSLFSQNLYQTELGVWGSVGEEERQRILALDLPGIMLETLSKRRQYINSSWASYILGYARSNDSGEINGEMGVEAYFNNELKGLDGFIEYQQDLYGYKMANSNEIREDAVNGSNIYLSIDSDVQNILENSVSEFSKDKNLDWVIFSVMDAKTGAVLGSASKPTFNPNTLEGLESYLNPLVSYQYEPGSTMKTFSWLASLENNTYHGSDKFISGTKKLSDGTTIKDFNNVGWGEIDYDTGFAYSSNVAASNLGLELGSAKLTDYYNLCGFGDKTGITLPGEEAGKVDITYESEVANASFGQGILVTPIQLMQAMSAVCNDGVMVKPYIVSKIENSDGKVVLESKREEIGRIASHESISKMKELLYNVVYNGFSYNKGYSPSNVKIMGKTGTAQIASNYGGYLTGEYDYIKSFLGAFPYENPKYVFYFATKRFVGPSDAIMSTISKGIEDVANSLNATDNGTDVDNNKIIYLSEYTSKDVNEVKKTLTEQGLVPVILGDGKNVIKQYPYNNTKVISSSKVFILTNKENITMPDVTGWSENEIIRLCNFIGLKYQINGYGKVSSVNILPGEVIDLNKTLEINLNI